MGTDDLKDWLEDQSVYMNSGLLWGSLRTKLKDSFLLKEIEQRDPEPLQRQHIVDYLKSINYNQQTLRSPYYNQPIYQFPLNSQWNTQTYVSQYNQNVSGQVAGSALNGQMQQQNQVQQSSFGYIKNLFGF